MFRPRPFVDISKTAADKINSSFKDFQKAYEDEDDRIINSLKYQQEEKQKLMKVNFMEFVNSKRSQWTESKSERVALLGYDEDAFDNLVLDSEVMQETIL